VDPELTPERRRALLLLARDTLAAHLRREPLPDLPAALPPGLRRGAFVTVRAHGALRGCLGRVSDDRPVADVVRHLTVAAASEDPRFPPLSLRELPHARVEIAVLSTPSSLDPVDPLAIVIGRDGLLVRREARSGLLLPQVALERRWSGEQFLAAVCSKAGLAPKAWREPTTQVLTFSAHVFGGDE
jgi:AmmeMemoRadiSam system protein A